MSDTEGVEDEIVEEEPIVQSKRVFINHVDSFVGKNISKILSKCVVGASLDAGDEEAGNEEEKGADKKENTYKIYGTVKNLKDYKKDDYITEVIKYETKEHLLEQLIECDIIIYDITQDNQQVDEACWSANALHNALDRIDKAKTFILLSTVMTWAKTKPVEPDDPELPFMEGDFRRRKAHPNFRDHLAAEKTILKLGKTVSKSNRFEKFLIILY
jgi:adenylate kinase